jgi:type VI secretion system secreted protein VgrG
MATRSGAGERLLSVSVASNDALDVQQFAVDERISALFTISLVAVSANENINFDAVIGQKASFSLRHARGERVWRGVVNHLRHIGISGAEEGLSTYQLTIVPDLWFSSQRKNYRMFQQITEPDIVISMLKDDWSIEPDVRLTEKYKKRKYRVQYGESDYAFMRRMLEDSGISFHFEDKDGETKLVLSDAPHLNNPRAPIRFRDKPAESGAEFVTDMRIEQQVRPGKYTMRDHDYRLAPTYKLAKSASLHNVPIEERLERFQYVPGAFLFGADKGEDTPSADDRGKARTDEREGEVLARKRLEAKRGAAKVLTFDTNARDLSPGVVVSFTEHPRTELGSGKRWLVVAAQLGGTPGGRWTHTCEARSTETPYRPPLVTPKPKVNGVESATVVGPAGEEIHCDEFGRVRVHFHWDRESQMDEKSSCWIHASQPWGGAGYGGTNLPRIGQEVLVDFLGGDPDRPIIVGRVYTNVQKTPYKLPDNKTQSGWKTNSTGGGGGYNELMFEDAQGKELVNIQAQKDLKKLVKNNENVTIGNNRTKLVQANDSLTVGANRTHRVQLNEQVSVGMSQKVSVGINRATHVGAVDSTTVGDTHVVTITPPGEGGGGASSSVMLKDKKIVLSTGAGATITMEGARITLAADAILVKAKNYAIVQGRGGVRVRAASGDVIVRGSPKIKLNP